MTRLSEHPCNLSTWCIVQVIHSPGPLITSMILTLLSRGIKVNQISHPLISRSLISTFIGQSKSSRSLDPQLVAVVGTSKPSIGCSNIFNTLSNLISMGIKTQKCGHLIMVVTDHHHIKSEATTSLAGRKKYLGLRCMRR